MIRAFFHSHINDSALQIQKSNNGLFDMLNNRGHHNRPMVVFVLMMLTLQLYKLLFYAYKDWTTIIKFIFTFLKWSLDGLFVTVENALLEKGLRPHFDNICRAFKEFLFFWAFWCIWVNYFYLWKTIFWNINKFGASLRFIDLSSTLRWVFI